jgi:hypothetical protein
MFIFNNIKYTRQKSRSWYFHWPIHVDSMKSLSWYTYIFVSAWTCNDNKVHWKYAPEHPSVSSVVGVYFETWSMGENTKFSLQFTLINPLFTNVATNHHLYITNLFIYVHLFKSPWHLIVSPKNPFKTLFLTNYFTQILRLKNFIVFSRQILSLYWLKRGEI